MTLRLLPLAVLAVVVAACSGGEEVIERADLEREVAAQLAEAVDQPEPDISCSEELEAEVDATVTCELSVEGDPDVYPVTVTVTEVEDGDATFDIEVGESPIE